MIIPKIKCNPNPRLMSVNISHFQICKSILLGCFNLPFMIMAICHLWLWQRLLGGLFCDDKWNNFASYGSPNLVMRFYVIILTRKYWYWILILQYFLDTDMYWYCLSIFQIEYWYWYFSILKAYWILNTSTFILYWSMLWLILLNDGLKKSNTENVTHIHIWCKRLYIHTSIISLITVNCRI